MPARRSAILLFVFLPIAAAGIFAQSPAGLDRLVAESFPDNADLRAKFFSSVIGAPKEVALAYGEKIAQSSSGLVLVRTVKRADDFLVEFLNGPEGAYSERARGSCIIQRSNPKGFLVQAKIRLYASGESTKADVVMYGAVVKKGISIPGMLYSVLTKPISEIVEATRGALDWSSVFRFGDRGESAAFVARLRAEAGAGVGGTAAELISTDIAAAGSSGPRELSLPTSPAARPVNFADDRGEPAPRLPYADFPRYEPGKGIPIQALRALVYVDSLVSIESVYLVAVDGLRALAIATTDGKGALDLTFFSGGRELKWDELAAGRRDVRARIFGFPASTQ
jgi:hypothetical protein